MSKFPKLRNVINVWWHGEALFVVTCQVSMLRDVGLEVVAQIEAVQHQVWSFRSCFSKRSFCLSENDFYPSSGWAGTTDCHSFVASALPCPFKSIFVKLKARYMEVDLALSLYEFQENYAVGIRPVGHAE